MRLLLIAATATLIGCGDRNGPTFHTPEHHTLMMVAGDEERARAFEAAARQCGVEGLSRVPRPGGIVWVRVAGPISTDEDIRSYSCAEDWVTTHAEGLRFVVEEEAGDLWN